MHHIRAHIAGRRRVATTKGSCAMSLDAEQQAARAAAEPRGELAARTLAMPADTNPSGDIFGGWIMSLMDAAGAITATSRADGRVVTAAVSNIAFLQPV